MTYTGGGKRHSIDDTFTRKCDRGQSGHQGYKAIRLILKCVALLVTKENLNFTVELMHVAYSIK